MNGDAECGVSEVRHIICGAENQRILASLAALRAKVIGCMDYLPGVALSESGNPGLISSTPLASSLCRAARGTRVRGTVLELLIALI
jgi:hypothetical protein